MPTRGVIAAGHPLSAEAGARVLREGGNAVDAAVAACLMSWVCEPVLTGPGAKTFAPGGDLLQEGETLRLPEVADLLERLGRDGPGFAYDGDVATAVSNWVLERGGLITRQDLADYDVIDREPARAGYHG